MNIECECGNSEWLESLVLPENFEIDVSGGMIGIKCKECGKEIELSA